MYEIGDFVKAWRSKTFGTVTDVAVWDDEPGSNFYYRVEDHSGREYWFNEDEIRPAAKIEQFIKPYYTIVSAVMVLVLYLAFAPH